MPAMPTLALLLVLAASRTVNGIMLVYESLPSSPAPHLMLTSPWIEVANLAYAGLPGRLGRERRPPSVLARAEQKADGPPGGAAMGLLVEEPMREHLYEVISRIHLPSEGVHTLTSTVRVTEHARAVESPEGGSAVDGLYEMCFESGVMVNEETGSSMSLSGKHDMTIRPFYFRQAADGTIVAVHHHASDHPSVVSSKRVFASALQHSLAQAGPSERRRLASRRTWAVVETDAVGPAHTEYQVRSRDKGERHHVSKRQLYRQSPAVPAGFRMEQNTSMELDEHGVPHAIHQSMTYLPGAPPQRTSYRTRPLAAARPRTQLSGGGCP